MHPGQQAGIFFAGLEILVSGLILRDFRVSPAPTGLKMAQN